MTSALFDALPVQPDEVAKVDREKIAASDRDDRLTNLLVSRDVAIELGRCFSGRTSPHESLNLRLPAACRNCGYLPGGQRETSETIREQSRPIRSVLTGSKRSAALPSVVHHNRLLQKLNLAGVIGPSALDGELHRRFLT